ncbi:MAG: GNAT family N-acetyltransferase [Muribaculaceae bacterium]|nr:GNAT family N-acetyltransferase [Muribaculaceae bacterium]
MVRYVDPERDVEDIARIYGWYVRNTTVTFEFEPLTTEEMLERIRSIASAYPYYVWDECGRVTGYCYAHAWKSFPAYAVTVESTVYVSPEVKGRGIGRMLMERLTEECAARGFVSMIACVTSENEESCRFHERLGFEKVSSFRKVGNKFNRLLDVVDYQLPLVNVNYEL